MNKAFVKDPEPGEARCPRCGVVGLDTSRDALRAYVPAERLSDIGEWAFFCPTATCEVAYFDALERTVPADALRKPVYPKDHAAPICACFGVTTDDLDRDVREGVATRIKELLKKAESPAARCGILAASGQSCVPEAQRYFLKARAAARGETA